MITKDLIDKVLNLREKVARLKTVSTSDDKEEVLDGIRTNLTEIENTEKANKREIATITPGAKVSWTDHLGRFNGTVEEVHHTKVTRPVRMLRAYKGNQEHTITRFGTYKNPVLYIKIDGSSLDSEDAGMALMSLRQIIQIDEDPNNGMGR